MEAVACEPLSTPNSHLEGNLDGKFCKNGANRILVSTQVVLLARLFRRGPESQDGERMGTGEVVAGVDVTN